MNPEMAETGGPGPKSDVPSDGPFLGRLLLPYGFPTVERSPLGSLILFVPKV